MKSGEKFRIRAGSIIGAEHQRRQVNNQDGYVTGETIYQDKHYFWGIICDGCSAGLHSEVGAVLLANYLCQEIAYLISFGSTLSEIPDQLFIAGLSYLRSLASQTAKDKPTARINFIKNHLLCTVIGFILDEQDCIFFNAGDGVIIVNNDITRIDQKNMPLYMAYHLLHKDLLKDFNQQSLLKFSTQEFKLDELEHFAVCSDGMEENIISQIWEHEHILGLQRKLRVFRLHKQALFSDDCTVIAVEKIKPKRR